MAIILSQKDDFWYNIKNEDKWRDLVLSIGTHRRIRRLSPVEVATLLSETIKKGEKYGVLKEEIAKELQLRDTSMMYKFLSLLKIPKEFYQLIVWGNKKNKISFSSAFYTSHLSDKEMTYFLESILSYDLTKNEARQVSELKRRSNFDIKKCIDEVLLGRPIIREQTMFIGLIKDKTFLNKLMDVPPNLRNIKFNQYLGDIFKGINISSARLSNNRFIFVTNNAGIKKISEISSASKRSIEQFVREKLENWWDKNVL